MPSDGGFEISLPETGGCIAVMADERGSANFQGSFAACLLDFYSEGNVLKTDGDWKRAESVWSSFLVFKTKHGNREWEEQPRSVNYYFENFQHSPLL